MLYIYTHEISSHSGTPKPLIGTLEIWWLVSANHLQYELLQLGMMNIPIVVGTSINPRSFIILVLSMLLAAFVRRISIYINLLKAIPGTSKKPILC